MSSARQFPTHFLCIPLAGAQLARSLSLFRAEVTSPTTFDIPGKAVRPLGTLHLTLGVMYLRGEGALDRAVELLRSLGVADILTAARTAGRRQGGATVDGPSRLSLTLRSLRSMQPAERAVVLYAEPSDAQMILYDFCRRLRGKFLDAGLMLNDERPLLLHATVLHTGFVRTRGRGRGRDKLTIDARSLLSRYEDYVWAEDIPVSRLAICRMGAKPIEGTDDAAYQVEAQVDF